MKQHLTYVIDIFIGMVLVTIMPDRLHKTDKLLIGTISCIMVYFALNQIEK